MATVISAKEKRILELIRSECKVYQLKDIEALASSLGGVAVSSVKDVVQALVDAGLVQRTEIGSITWYSSLPDPALRQKRAELNALKAEVEQLKVQLDALVRKLGLEQAVNEGRDLDEVLSERLEFEEVRLTDKLAKYGDIGDREQFETTLQPIQTCREANKHNMQNLRILQALYRDKLGVTLASLYKQTGIPVNLSDME